MVNYSLFALALVVAAGPRVCAADAPRFTWKAGDAHTFDVIHHTTILETASAVANGPIVTTKLQTKLTLRRTWTVTAVDANGNAALALAITSFRNETTRGGPDGSGETTIIDSASPEGAQHVAQHLNKTILTATVDARGRVSEVKTDNAASAARLKAELPFRIEWPETAAAKWSRDFAITLDPPAGTGEAFDAVQIHEATDMPGQYRITTSLKKPPTDAAELQPLLPFLWEGTITIDPQSRQYQGCKLAVQKTIEGHQGKGTKFKFESAWEETRVVK
jgi:hypothetical protein